MQELNFSKFNFTFQVNEQNKLIFDIVRKKFIPLTPEEWVRQHVIHYFAYEKNVNPNRMAVEKQLIFNQLKKRFDLVLFSKESSPICMVECKAPHIAITTDVVLQAATYNRSFHCPHLMLTNGIHTVWFEWTGEKLLPGSEPDFTKLNL